MGAVIDAVEIVRSRAGSSTDLAAEAAQRALKGASAEMLVNAGVYRDANVMEPASATFVQRSIDGHGPTLAFDLSNGACGVLNAIQVVDGFLSTGAIRRGLVVTADVDVGQVPPGDGLEPVGAAIVLVPGQPGEGFEAFWQWTYPDHAALHRSTIEWTGREHALQLHEDPAFRERSMACIHDAIHRIFHDSGLCPADVDLVVASATQAHVGSPVPTSHVVAALDDAMDARGGRSRRVLVVAAGSGITIAAASYVRPETS